MKEKMKDFTESEKQDMARKLVDDNILANISVLTYELETGQYDNIFNLYADVDNISYNEEELKDMYGEYWEDYDYEIKDIFEWWIVSDWLAERLREEENPLWHNGNNYVWGRETTGQAICLDYIIQKIAVEYYS